MRSNGPSSVGASTSTPSKADAGNVGAYSKPTHSTFESTGSGSASLGNAAASNGEPKASGTSSAGSLVVLDAGVALDATAPGANTEPTNDNDTKCTEDCVTDSGTPSPGRVDAGSAVEGEQDEPGLYAIASNGLGDDGTADSFLFLTSNLSTDLTETDAVLRFGNDKPLVFGVAKSGQFFVAHRGETTSGPRVVQRYQVGEDGKPLEDGSLELDLSGEYGSSFHFVNATTAYALGRGSKLIVWNPTEMKTVESVTLTDTLDPSSVGIMVPSATPLEIGGDLFVGFGWLGSAGSVMQGSGVLILDGETHASQAVRDMRCPYARDGALGSDGYIYFGTEAYAATAYVEKEASTSGQTSIPEPCLVRFDPVTRSYDPEFLVRKHFAGEALDRLVLSSLVGSETGSSFVRLLDPDLVAGDIYGTAGARILSSAGSVFRWARVDVDAKPLSVTLLNTPPTHGSVVPLRLAGRVFVPRFIWGHVSSREDIAVAHAPMLTEFIALGSKGPSNVRFTVPGQVFSALKVR